MSDGDLQAAYLSEHLGDEGEVPQWALYVDRDKLRYLLKMEEALPNAEDSDEFNRMRKQLKATAANKAIDNDDLTTVSAIKGISDNSVDATGYDMLMDRIEPAAQTVLIKGAKGTGKTTKAADWVKKAMDDEMVEKVMTNVQLNGFKDDKFEESSYDVRFSEVISDYLEFAKEPGEKLMLLDELSTVANLLGSAQDAQDIFPRVINALRKSKGGSCRIVAIGHEHDTDILPSLRNNSDGVLEAPNKKGEGIDRAVYYESFEDYQNGDEEFKLRGLQDVTGHSLFGFDDNSFATLEFNLDAPEKQIQRGKIIDDWHKYQDEDSESRENSEEDLAFCAGDGCNSNSKQYPELKEEKDFCPYHSPSDAPDDYSKGEDDSEEPSEYDASDWDTDELIDELEDAGIEDTDKIRDMIQEDGFDSDDEYKF